MPREDCGTGEDEMPCEDWDGDWGGDVGDGGAGAARDRGTSSERSGRVERIRMLKLVY